MLLNALTPVCDIAQGGMGYVRLCLRSEGTFRRLYAVKRLHAHLRGDEGVRSMFLEEARLSGLVRHANVVSVLDVGEDEQGPFLVMDFVDGVSVAAIISDVVATGDLLPLQFCLSVALDVARGLHAAHELTGPDGQRLGLVHRDISPQNILVGFDGTTRVTDFGIARAFGRSTKSSLGMLKGNAAYIAPEQLRFDEPDARADIFSLGVVLYELYTGTPLYSATPGPEAARRILGEPPPDVGDARPDAPPGLVELMFRMLAKEVEERPASAAEVVHALEGILVAVLRDESHLDSASYLRRRFEALRIANRPEVAAALAGQGEPPKTDPGVAPSPSPPTLAAAAAPRASKRVPLWALATAILIIAGVATGLRWNRAPAPASPQSSTTTERPSASVGPRRGIWAGAWHTCATRGQRLHCWGKNNEGQLGNDGLSDAALPTPVSLLDGVIDADGGSYHTCAIVRDGRLLCFGRNTEGQLGTGTAADQRVPTPIASEERFIDVDAGMDHTCAVTRSGTVLCWGDNQHGQLGDGTMDGRAEPRPVLGIDGAAEVSAGGRSTCARTGGRVHCWGHSFDERSARVAHVRPVLVPGLDDAVQISVGGLSVCAVRRGGKVACWGFDRLGHRGDGARPPRIEPRDVPGLDPVLQVAVSSQHLCAVMRSRTIACWGRNQWGNIGVGSTDEVLAPTEVPGIDDAFAVTLGNVHTCAARQSGGFSCWGHNDTGQLGDGTMGKDRLLPVSVVGLRN